MKSLQLKKPTQISSEDTGNSSKPIIYKDVRCHSESKVKSVVHKVGGGHLGGTKVPSQQKKKKRKKETMLLGKLKRKKYIKYTTLQKYINTCNCWAHRFKYSWATPLDVKNNLFFFFNYFKLFNLFVHQNVSVVHLRMRKKWYRLFVILFVINMQWRTTAVGGTDGVTVGTVDRLQHNKSALHISDISTATISFSAYFIGAVGGVTCFNNL